MTPAIKITIILALSLPTFAGDFEFASFDFPTCTVNFPSGLNSRAQVVGFCSDDSGDHGFMLNLNNRRWTKFDFPGSTFTVGAAINARGQIVGRWRDATGLEPRVLAGDERRLHLL